MSTNETPSRQPTQRKWIIAFVAAATIALASGLGAGLLERSTNELRAVLAADQGEIQQLNDQVGELQQAAQEQAVQLELARQPVLPVTVNFYPISGGDRSSGAFVSTAPSQLEVEVAVTDPLHHTHRRFELTLLPQHRHDSPPGWSFQSGEEVDLTSDGFQPLHLTVPAQERQGSRLRPR